MDTELIVIIYLVGMILTAGAIGGVRDGAEGIIDEAIILFWPLSLVIKILIMICTGLYKIGKMLG